MDPWKIGEGHDRGLPEDFSAFVVFLQLNAWQLGGASKKITHAGNARNQDRAIVARCDGTVWLRHPGSRFKKVANSSGEVTGLAIGAEGRLATRLVDEEKVKMIDLEEKKVVSSWDLPSPSLEIILLDTGEVVVSHLDGTITIWNPEDASKPKAQIRLASKSPNGLHLRALPQKAEFMACLDGDLVIHHFSADDGEAVGPPIRHERGLYWMLFAGYGDFLVSIDQDAEGKGVLRVWSLRLRSEIVPPIEHPDQILWVTILDNGGRIATSCGDKRIRRWIIDGSAE